jgi:probable rRNA maturation factor
VTKRQRDKETSVVVKNLNKKFRINEKFIKKIAADILSIFKKKKGLEIVFLGDKEIKPINRKYKRRNVPTDVLSFELGELGEIIISSDTALRNSEIFHTSFEEEIVLYVIHGILHLFGYDDGTVREKKRMSKKEDVILEALCQENFSKVLMQR